MHTLYIQKSLRTPPATPGNTPQPRPANLANQPTPAN
jgi:hypothetical protein